jgi:hypothetical protein
LNEHAIWIGNPKKNSNDPIHSNGEGKYNQEKKEVEQFRYLKKIAIFLRRASDSVFKFLAFLQQWYPLCRRTGNGWTACWRIFYWRHANYLRSPAVELLYTLRESCILRLPLVGHVCAVAPANLFLLCCAGYLNFVWMWLLYL